jgi:endonuclease/exonuclease/phosphatase family metal-dependent hydrolase
LPVPLPPQGDEFHAGDMTISANLDPDHHRPEAEPAATRLCVATFNLENLDDKRGLALGDRVAVLRPQLCALDADILCLQEVNGQKPRKREPRRLVALDTLLHGTQYESFTRLCTLTPDGDPADVHNLVILSRFPVTRHAQYWHDLVAAPSYRVASAVPPDREARPVTWDRPILWAEVMIGRHRLHVVNLHLRAPLAATIPGQKLAAGGWASIGGWAEGFLIATMKRTGQAVETRLLVECILDAEPDALVVVAGDLNAEANESPVRVLRAAAEDTRNIALSRRALVSAADTLPEAQRYSFRFHGRKMMLDHVLMSSALSSCLTRVTIANRDIVDEAEAEQLAAAPTGSLHAPIAAHFLLK